MPNIEWMRRGRSTNRGLRPWCLAVLVLVLAAGGCATARNYLDPSGPVYEEHYAAPDTVVSAGSRTDGSIRVVSFNIAFAEHIDRALEILEESEPLQSFDVLMLQEMDPPGVDRIARELGLNYVYFPSGVHPRKDRDFGCAILSPWPLREARKIVLPHGARGSGLVRAVVVATVVRGERRFQCYAVHLSAPLSISGSSRREQARVLIADALTSRDPVVIAGDFNSYDVGHEFADAGFTWPTRDTGPTIKRFFLTFHYDHVFARDASGRPIPGSADVVKDNRGASDHKAIWAALDFDVP